MRIFWFAVILAILALGHTVPAKKKQDFIDDSDRTLIRVARSDLDEDEDEPQHEKHIKKLHHHKRSAEAEHKRNRRAALEDNFFQALLSRTPDVKQEKKRSFDDSADSKGSIIRNDWKGDSRISDVDRQELENLFSAINTEDDTEEEKVQVTRSVKPGFNGKVENFIEWLLSQPPSKFTKSLSHILDVQTKLTKMFYGAKSNFQQQDQAQATNQNVAVPEAAQTPSPQQITYADPNPYPAQTQPAYQYSTRVPAPAPEAGPQPVYFRKPEQQIKLEAPHSWPIQKKCFGRLCAKSKAPKPKAPAAKDAAVKPAPKPVPAPQAPRPAVPAGPQTFDVPGATIHMSPLSVTQGASPMMPMDPYNPYQAQAPAPAIPPYQTGFQVSPMKRKLVPKMPKDCEDYTEKRCQIFLDWPSDENNEVKASLRFKNNWNSEYKDRKSTKHNIFKAEVEKAIKKAYKSNKNFKGVEVTKLRDEDMKTLAEFTLKFKKEEKSALRHLEKSISKDYLASMPVYKDTLLADGLPHKHRKIVTSQKELDQIPDSKPETQEDDSDDTADLMSTHSTAYQGCFKDKKPGRDLPVRFSKYEMTPEWCIGRCKVANYKFAGLQYGYLCFCGNKFGTYGRAAEKECSSKCFGDKKRKCGAFWHNSVYSVDGDAHKLSEFDNMKDEDDEKKSKDDKRNKIQANPGHTEVANHLMKAAEAALRAAKKLLPQGGKDKRDAQDDYKTEKAKAVAALGAATTLINEQKETDRQKRDTELNSGKDLLVAYLNDVGGYDRQYRNVDDEDEDGVGEKGVKVDYKRMVIDESGDGEFVEKKVNENVKKAKRRERRSVEHQYPTDDDLFDGPKKMASRAIREEDEPSRNNNADSGVQVSMPGESSDAPETEEEQDPMAAEVVPEPRISEDPVRKAQIATMGKPDVTAPAAPAARVVSVAKTPAAAPVAPATEELPARDPLKEIDEVVSKADSVETVASGESGSAQDSANDSAQSGDQAGESGDGDKALPHGARGVENEEKELSRRARDASEEDEDELPKKRGKNMKKRQLTFLDQDTEETIKQHVKQGVAKLKDLVVELYRQQKTIKAFEAAVAQLRKDIIDHLKVPDLQREQAIKEIRTTMKSTAIEELKGITGSIRKRLNEYAKEHPAVSIEAEEAGNSLKDIPLYEDQSDEIKKNLKKRSVEIEQEIIKRSEGSEEIPDILKEHFKRNAPETEEGSTQ